MRHASGCHLKAPPIISQTPGTDAVKRLDFLGARHCRSHGAQKSRIPLPRASSAASISRHPGSPSHLYSRIPYGWRLVYAQLLELATSATTSSECPFNFLPFIVWGHNQGHEPDGLVCRQDCQLAYSGDRLRFPSVNSELNESCIRLRLSALGKSCPPARALIIALCRRYEATILICSLSTGESC